MISSRLMAFDTASLYYRAYFALPASLKSSTGHPVNAIRGLLDFLARFLNEYRPTHVACAWDEAWRPAWRVALVPSYKAARAQPDGTEETPADLAWQVTWIRAVLQAAGIAVIGVADHEADDVLASLVAQTGFGTDVVTGDRDLFSLVNDQTPTRVLYVGRGVSTHDQVNDSWLLNRYGITGSQYADFATLRGDPSDGLVGVAGVGEKTATGLLQEFKDLPGIIQAAHAGRIRPRLQAAIIEAEPYLEAASQVVRMRPDLPLTLVPPVPGRPVDASGFAGLVAELNLGRSAERFVAALQACNT